MTVARPDLERILAELPNVVPDSAERGRVHAAVLAAYEFYLKNQSNQLLEIYAHLRQGNGYINAFQIAARVLKNGSPTKDTGHWYGYAKADYPSRVTLGHQESVREQFERAFPDYFEKDPLHNRKSEGKVGLILERSTEGNGVLFSYGFSHGDSASHPTNVTIIRGRANPHYFDITGKYDKLKAVVDATRQDPGELRRMVQEVFGWENKRIDFEPGSNFQDGLCSTGYQIDIFRNMLKLKVKVETDVQEYQMK